MPGLTSSREKLDDQHASTATWAKLSRCVRCARIGRRRCGHGKQRTHPAEVVRACIAGEKPIMADAVQPLWQDMDQEAADELVGIERHGLVAAGTFDPVVLDLESDAAIVDRKQAPVRDGDAVSVARQISEHRLGTGEGAFGIDEPLGLFERYQEGGERFCAGEMGVFAEEGELACLMRSGQLLDHQAPEQFGEHAHRQEEAWPARDPPFAVERDAAAGNDHMHMWVVGHRRAPCMKHRGYGDACAQMLRVGGDLEQRFRGRLEQEIVDHRLVLIGDLGDGRRQSEHHMEIRHVEQLRLPRFHPVPRGRTLAFGAMPVAAANGECPLLALWAKLVMGSWQPLCLHLREFPPTPLTITKRP